MARILFPILLLMIHGTLLEPFTPAQAGQPAVYTVVRGDNLSVIAQRFGVSLGDLRRTNRIQGDLIHVGQEIRIDNPLHGIRAGQVRWARPVRKPGPVLRSFGQYKVRGVLMPRTGTDVACAWGTPVNSPAHGVVRHIGQMEGFGTLMIIEHGGGYASVLAPFDPESVTVTTGQAVNRGSLLGRTGRPDDQDHEPFLHVELRKDNKSIKPDRLLK